MTTETKICGKEKQRGVDSVGLSCMIDYNETSKEKHLLSKVRITTEK